MIASYGRAAVHTITRLRRLPRGRRRALRQALLAIVAIRLGLTILGFRRLHRLLRPVLTVRPATRPIAAAEISWSVERAARAVPAATCLTQALAAQILLARAGHPAALRLGARRTGATLEAHAWLEDEQGIVFGKRGTFAALPPIEPLLH
jgi:hypothetical protein